MKWSEIRLTYPDQWLVVEALEAHTQPDSQRRIERFAVIEPCADGGGAMQTYRRLHQQYPDREFYFVHTSREELDIRERQWLGIRRANAVKVSFGGMDYGFAINGILGADFLTRARAVIELGRLTIHFPD